MMNLTVVELKKAIKNLGGTGYSKLNKDELQQFLTNLLTKQNKEATQMKNTLAFDPMDNKTSSLITRGNMNKRHLAPSERQIKYFEALKRNYAFPEEVVSFNANNMAHMSKALDRMNEMVHAGKVKPVAPEIVQQELKALKGAKTSRTVTSTSNEQREQLKQLAIVTKQVIKVPKTSIEAQRLIDSLTAPEPQTAPEAQTAPKKLSFFQRILAIFSF